MKKTQKEKLSEAHRETALAMGVPQMSVKQEQRFTAIAREAAGEREAHERSTDN